MTSTGDAFWRARRQSSGPTNRNHVRPHTRVRLPNESKPNSRTESFAPGIRVKECVSTRGGLTGGMKQKTFTMKSWDEWLRRRFRIQNIDLFIEHVKQDSDLSELTPYMANEQIKAIYVGAPDKSSGKRRQNIYIQYDLIGFIPLDELMKQETA